VIENAKDVAVSVVIVTYRSAALTVDCIRSIHAERASSLLQVSVIVVDNASGDLGHIASEIEANGWENWIRLVSSPLNGGFAYGNNLGIREAFSTNKNSYIYLVNPDTQLRPGAIDSLVTFLETHPAVGIAGSSFENIDGSEWPISFNFPSILGELTGGLEIGLVSAVLRKWVVARTMSPHEQAVDWICGASMMVRPAVFGSIGGMDENYFLYFEETDFCRRARSSGFPTWYVPASRVMHIMGQSTKVTDLTLGARRLPPYWFESRRRYFAVTFGMSSAIAIDLVAIFAFSLGYLKRLLLGRKSSAVPHFIRDLINHSILWKHNRYIPPIRQTNLTNKH
jgi:GT2 family glycosyltransferase